jgi:hypothetical protein
MVVLQSATYQSPLRTWPNDRENIARNQKDSGHSSNPFLSAKRQPG